jgi:hypothetical protein
MRAHLTIIQKYVLALKGCTTGFNSFTDTNFCRYLHLQSVGTSITDRFMNENGLSKNSHRELMFCQ